MRSELVSKEAVLALIDEQIARTQDLAKIHAASPAASLHDAEAYQRVLALQRLRKEAQRMEAVPLPDLDAEPAGILDKLTILLVTLICAGCLWTVFEVLL